MKTALFIPTFIKGEDKNGFSNRSRVLKFINYHLKIAEHLGIEQVFISNNGQLSPDFLFKFLQDIERRHDFQINIKTNQELQRGFNLDYSPCWRAAYDMEIPIYHGFEKIISMDSDAFVLSKRLADHIKNLESGWESLWCKKYNFPESCLSVACADSFPIFKEFIKTPIENRNGIAYLETTLPYTKVNKSFVCDRYGEQRIAQTNEMDAYFQTPTDFDVKCLF